MGIGSTLEAARIGAREPSSYMGAGHLCDLAWYIRKYESGVINWGRWREEGGEFLLVPRQRDYDRFKRQPGWHWSVS
jgi:hypothetical protein